MKEAATPARGPDQGPRVPLLPANTVATLAEPATPDSWGTAGGPRFLETLRGHGPVQPETLWEARPGTRGAHTLGSTRAPALMRYFTASRWLFSAASISGVLWSSEQVSMFAPACEMGQWVWAATAALPGEDAGAPTLRHSTRAELANYAKALPADQRCLARADRP